MTTLMMTKRTTKTTATKRTLPHWGSLFVLACVMMSGSVTWGRDLHVDPVSGKDSNDGIAAPVKTIARGIALALPGDTVHLKPIVYHDLASFTNRHGLPDHPITLDGHGATLNGAEALIAADWEEVAPGRFRNERLMPSFNAAMLGRWYFLFDGRPVHMGRTSKGKQAPLKTPESLQPGEWTFVPSTESAADPSRRLTGAFYIQIQPGQKFDDAKISFPLRSNGVQLGGKNSHLVIRNITATHVWNDGFNIHGDCNDVHFENIRAIECGDDGISGHETAKYTVHRFYAEGNSTGICDVNFSETTYENVEIRDCIAFDLYFLNHGKYKVTNAIIHSTSERGLVVTPGGAMPACQVELENILFLRKGPPINAFVGNDTTLTVNRSTFVNLGFSVAAGTVSFEKSLLAGQPPQNLILGNGAKWTGRDNLYDLNSYRVQAQGITREGFVSYQQESANEIGSQWKTVEIVDGTPANVPAGIGFDRSRFKSVEMTPAK